MTTLLYLDTNVVTIDVAVLKLMSDRRTLVNTLYKQTENIPYKHKGKEIQPKKTVANKKEFVSAYFPKGYMLGMDSRNFGNFSLRSLASKEAFCSRKYQKGRRKRQSKE
ncbi:hypothetical protein AVEN_217448-1 [Araneus ventricosus]|uniref:Uncharacterized protein n=1 Tax=Araneus ventricosus TaxID=182803 RepID=A0A4Y2NLB7_ARAVE|nr:hypothetical protein AVEN_217448-1 [Araneus ventricosus]